MRLIGSIKTEEELKILSLLFQKQGIEHSYEFQPKNAKEESHFNVWIVDEDKIDQAQNIFEKFIASKGEHREVSHEEKQPSSQAVFETPPISPQAKYAKSNYLRSGLITNLLIAVCVFFFIIQQIQFARIKTSENEQQMQVITPSMTLMLYDFPKTLELIQSYQNRYHKTPFSNGQLTVEEQNLRQEILKTPTWTGIYPLIIFQLQGEKEVPWGAPKFEKISHGEIWRIFTPIFLHASLVHLLFNMLWLFVLGSSIESRIGKWRYLVFIAITAAISNTSQYLTSGFLFLGYSGVITAYAGFIYSRKNKAPWEGYPIQRVVLWFMFAYIFILLALQIFIFLLSVLSYDISHSLFFNIANAAHLAGLIAGLILGRMSVFAWSAK